MKKIFYLFILILSVQIAKANSALLDKSNQLYADQKYEQAIEGYEQIVNGGFESAELYFNLANAYYKTAQISKAILFYEKAKLLNPHDEDIAYNLALANQHITDKFDQLPQPFFTRWWKALIGNYSTDSWAWTSLITFIVFIILLSVFLITASGFWKRISFWFGSLLLTTCCFTFYFAHKQKKVQTGHKHAIVFSPSITVKSTPAESGTELFVIHEGIKVQLTDSVSNWKEIRLPDGNIGWLQDSCIVRI